MKKYFPLILLFFSGTVSWCSSSAQKDNYYTSFDGVKIWYEIFGKGKPVLLVHGFTGTAGDWKNKPLADSLLAHGYQLIIPDLRGNGHSDKPRAAEAYANNAEAKDLAGLMHFLGIGKYDAVGYSRGAIIVASLLVTDKNCKRAVLGGMGSGFTDPLWQRRIGFYNALMNDTVSGYDGFRKYIASKGLDPLVLAAQQKGQPAVSKKQLAGLNRPVMIICGIDDADNGKGSDLQVLIPKSVFVEVPGDHNTTAYTVPFAERILSFFKQ